MRGGRTAGWLALVILLSGAAQAREPGSDEAAKALLIRAADEIRQAGAQAEFHVLVDVARGLARFDRQGAAALIAQAFERAKAAKELTERLGQLESVALAAAHIDSGISTAAIEILRADSRSAATDARIELKIMAIDIVLAHRKGSPQEVAIRAKAIEFCKLNKSLRQIDLGMESRWALAEYVSCLEPELGISLYQDMWSDSERQERNERTWDARLAVAVDLVHYDAARAISVLRSLLEATADAGSKVRVAVALYKAGARDEAVALLDRLKPPAVGGGWPLGDLITRVGAADPQAALRLAATMGSDQGLRSAQDLAYQGAATGRPQDVPELIKDVKESYRRNSALRLAAEAMVSRGDLRAARDLADQINSSGDRAPVLGRIAEAAGDAGLMREAMRIARTAGGGGMSWGEVTASAVRAFGIKETEALLEQIEPELRDPQWGKKDLYQVLLLVAEEDPAWALDVFRRGPNVPPKRNHTTDTHAVSYLLPKLAAQDGDYVADYIAKNGAVEHPQVLVDMKWECVHQIASRSPADAQAFAAKIGIKADPYQLEWDQRNAQVMTAGTRINEVLEGMTFRHPDQRDELIRSAVSGLVGGPNDPFHHVDRIRVLAGAMKDKALADQVLGSAAPLLYACGEKKDALELIGKISSPARRAEAILGMTPWELDPRLRRDRLFLAGWVVRNRGEKGDAIQALE